MQEVFSNANNINLFLMILLLPSLHSKLVPFQYQDYAYGLLRANEDDLCFEKNWKYFEAPYSRQYMYMYNGKPNYRAIV